MAIGQDLLDVPFAEMVRNLAFAIAEGQLALDRSSIETLRFLLSNEVDIIPEVVEIIEPAVRQVDVNGKTIPVTGANIRGSGAQPVRLNVASRPATHLLSVYRGAVRGKDFDFDQADRRGFQQQLGFGHPGARISNPGVRLAGQLSHR